MLWLVKLRFKRAIRIGSGDLSQGEEFRGIIHSDTIFSAIINEWVGIYGRNSVEELILNLNTDSPPFKISSAFPYLGGEYYLPTPYSTEELYMDKLKDIPFLELFDFLRLAEGDDNSIKKISLKNPIEDLLRPFTTPRVTIDRITTSTNIYQVNGWLMREGGGLYFLIDFNDETLRHDENLPDKLKLCLKMLGENGIGGDRSIGYGLFDAEIIKAAELDGWTELFQKRPGQVSYYSLSLCCPLKNDEYDEAKEAVSYQILSRKGWIFSRSSLKQMKRRECKMFAEGSLFKSPIKGQIADVTPSRFQTDHKVFRYGLGMMISFCIYNR